jgi:hypothetical protein
MVTALALTSTTPRLTRKCSLHVYISASIEALLWLYSLSGALTSTTLRLTRKCSLYVPLTSTTVFPIYREHCPICATNVNDSVPVHIGNTVETLTSTTVFPICTTNVNGTNVNDTEAHPEVFPICLYICLYRGSVKALLIFRH